MLMDPHPSQQHAGLHYTSQQHAGLHHARPGSSLVGEDVQRDQHIRNISMHIFLLFYRHYNLLLRPILLLNSLY